MITLKEAVKKAITERNFILAGKITELLWHKKSMSYNQIYRFINGIMPIHISEWDEMMAEYDTER